PPGFAPPGGFPPKKKPPPHGPGDISNGPQFQGNGITLNAAGRLTNNGQLTAGNGTTALSGSGIAMNASGSLQAGGDVSRTRRGEFHSDAFPGPPGSRSLTAPGPAFNPHVVCACPLPPSPPPGPPQ
ncbi:hypothetical protein ACISSW_29040, partial [Escherichia coli]